MKKITSLILLVGFSMLAWGQVNIPDNLGGNTPLNHKDGSVGVGTTTPKSKLHVYQRLSINDISNNPNVSLINVALRTSDGFIPVNTESRLSFNFESWSNGEDTKGVIGFQIPENSNGWYGGSTLNFYTKAPAPGGGTSPGLINPFSIDRFGNATFRTIRSGTTSIPRKNIGLKLMYHTTGMHVPYGSENRIAFTTKAYGHGDTEIGSVAVKVGDEKPGSYGGGEMLFYTKDSSPGGGKPGDGLLERLRVDCKGRVGIGTTTPSAKLDVAGNIKAREIEVTLAAMQDLQLNGTLAANNITYTANGNTADFVFEDNYHLKDLSEVEAFIKANKHLPEIPSAAEMEEAGVNLAEMNKLLLMKVDELTLYSIELEKEVTRQKEEVEKVESLELKVEELSDEKRAMRGEMEKMKEDRSRVTELEERLVRMESLLEELSNR